MIDVDGKAVAPVRWAMVGGGRGSQIGTIHRDAATRGRTFDLVAGAFDIDPGRGRAFGIELGLDPARRGAIATTRRCSPKRRRGRTG